MHVKFVIKNKFYPINILGYNMIHSQEFTSYMFLIMNGWHFIKLCWLR